MGKESMCTARFKGKKSSGKALLETKELIFRGEFRLKVPLASLKSARAAKGELRLETPEGLAVLELGDQAAKWCEAILHPKSRIEKLGVKAGGRVALFGRLASEFLEELAEHTQNVQTGKLDQRTECVFLAASTKKDLLEVTGLAKKISGGTALWVVYAKGRKELAEKDVLSEGRQAGLKDVKVVSFSSTHTALKFVVPLELR